MKGESKNLPFDADISWFNRVRLTSHVLQREKGELCVPSALLCVVEASGGHADSDDIEGDKEGPQRLPERPSISNFFKHLWGKNSALRPRVHAFAVGRRFVTFPVLGLRVRLHQPPAQGMHRRSRCYVVFLVTKKKEVAFLRRLNS